MTEIAARERLLERIGYGDQPGVIMQTGKWRFRTPVHAPRLSPCRAACPAGSAIPDWLVAFGAGNHEKAWEIISRENPFPAITARTCFRFCEAHCNRGNLDQAIRIHRIEQAIGQWRRDHFQATSPPAATAKSVAVVGSGPAGLSCAFYLVREGLQVKIYEKEPVAGGLLATAIPEYRLPRTLVVEELEMLRREGVAFCLNCSVGETVPLEKLYREHDAVFLAAGASRPVHLALPGLDEQEMGAVTALEFLRRINLEGGFPLEAPVVVVGGGSAALDAARLAVRLAGMNAVTVVYRRGRKMMPADPEEVAAAETEGVHFLFYRVPVALHAVNGEKRLFLAHTGYSVRGEVPLMVRREEEMALPCGTLIQALGQEADLSIFGRLSVRRPFFAGGDLVTGPATIPAAIAAGRKAARAIAARLQGKPAPVDENWGTQTIALAELHLQSLAAVPLRPAATGLTGEAQRCLGCGHCTGCGLCSLFCPDLAIEPCGERYCINLDYCKGCGICVRECPAQALAMEGEDNGG